MITTPETKKIYAELQKQLFYLVPEKWDRIYLYASVIDQMLSIETGELFFYYFPKGIWKKNPVNVYEIPNKFNLNEEDYIKLVEKLYQTIKKLRDVYKRSDERVWSNITIRLVGLKFEIEFNYENLTKSPYNEMERHIIWKYNNLGIPLESFTRQERQLIKGYLNTYIVDISNTEKYGESIYKRPVKNMINYNKEHIDDMQQEETQENTKEDTKKAKTENKDKKAEKKEKKKEKKNKKAEQTYEEQVDAQREAVRSQILNQ